MTRPTPDHAGSPVPNFATHFAVLAVILCGWFLTMAVSVRFMPLSDDYLAIGPERVIVENLPPQARILRTRRHSVAVNMTGGHTGKSLYSAGAWIVLPGLANGCLALRKREDKI